MSIKREFRIQLTCFCCDQSQWFVTETEEQAMNDSKIEGWKVFSCTPTEEEEKEEVEYCYCPSCAREALVDHVRGLHSTLKPKPKVTRTKK